MVQRLAHLWNTGLEEFLEIVTGEGRGGRHSIVILFTALE